MFAVLKHRPYRNLFTAQVVALVGTGLLTVALSLLAFELAGASAGVVLGTALTIKMVIYVALSPVIATLASNIDRKLVLIAADVVRALVALSLPFIDSIWQIYALIAVLQTASATFTPAFQAVIPDLLPDERDYTNALSLSRLAYDIENLLSPAIAGLLLTVVAFHWLFIGTFLGFLISALIVLITVIPKQAKGKKDLPFRQRVTKGSRIYLSTPRLRGLLSLNVTIAALGSMILVNTIVLVRSQFDGSERDVAVALAFYGVGSMIAAFILPSVLGRVRDRSVMLFASVTASIVSLSFALLYGRFGLPSWEVFLCTWALLGLLGSFIATPSGRLLRRSSRAEDRPALFTAQFALSHACWLFAYPAAGYLGSGFGMSTVMVVLSLFGFVGWLLALTLWPKGPEQILEHSHDDLPSDHPHLADAVTIGGHRVHKHHFVIDDEHRVWPTQG